MLILNINFRYKKLLKVIKSYPQLTAFNSSSWSFKGKTTTRESGAVRAWGNLCPPRSFLRPAEYQTQKRHRKGPSGFEASSVGSRGIPSGPYSEPRAKADDRKRVTHGLMFTERLSARVFGVSRYIGSSGVLQTRQ